MNREPTFSELLFTDRRIAGAVCVVDGGVEGLVDPLPEDDGGRGLVEGHHEAGDGHVHGHLCAGVRRFRFVGATLPRDRAPEAHFGADFYPLNLERIAVACNSGFPLPASSRLMPARPTHALRCCRYFKKLVVRAVFAGL